MITFLKNTLIGAIVGIANIIPGVSGGTMMVVLGVFDKLIGAVSNIRKEFKKSVLTLLPFLLGAGGAILLLSSAITYLLDYHYMATNLFFVGVIVGSIPMVWKKSTAGGFRWQYVFIGLITLGIMLFTVYFAPDSSGDIIRELSVFSTIKLVVCSAIAAFSMIVPGISGSFMMLLFGTYTTVTTAISEMNILVLIPIAIGILIGLLFGSKLISLLLEKFPQATYFAILGFMIGSIPAIIENTLQRDALVGGISLVIGIAVFLIGGAVSYIFSDETLKDRIAQRKKARQS